MNQFGNPVTDSGGTVSVVLFLDDIKGGKLVRFVLCIWYHLGGDRRFTYLKIKN